MSCFCLHCPELFPAAGVGNASAMGWEQLGHGNVPAGCPCGEGILELPSLGCGAQPKIRLHSKALLVERHLLLFSSCPWLVFPASSSSLISPSLCLVPLQKCQLGAASGVSSSCRSRTAVHMSRVLLD